jgi:hypothetical protein
MTEAVEAASLQYGCVAAPVMHGDACAAQRLAAGNHSSCLPGRALVACSKYSRAPESSQTAAGGIVLRKLSGSISCIVHAVCSMAAGVRH